MTPKPAASMAAVALLLVTGIARAQCATSWQMGDGSDGVFGRPFAVLPWDPDGAGPLPPVCVVAGDFVYAADLAVNHIAAWDPATRTWSSLATGIDGNVRCLAVLPNGHLVAGGGFATAGGSPASCVASWDGIAWSAVGAGVGGAGDEVFSLCVLQNGDLVAAGRFATAGGGPASNVARWDGTQWQPLGTGTDGEIHATGLHPNGDLVVGGTFANAGGVAADNIARWNGANWSPLAAGVPPGLDSLVVRQSGEVLVAGATFPAVGSWNGTAWSALPLQNQFARTLLLDANGVLYMGGSNPAFFGLPPSGVLARWIGSSWQTLGAPDRAVTALGRTPAGEIVAGGEFTRIDRTRAHHLARLPGTTWSTMTDHADAPGLVVLPLPDGGYVVGGSFNSIGGVAASHIARWTGTGYVPLGSGIVGGVLGGALSGNVNALARLPNGDIVAGGEFTIAGGVTAFYLARWDGANWSAFNGSNVGVVSCMQGLPNGDLIVGGAGLARWNGTSWSNFGSLLGGPSFGPAGVSAIARRPNGDILVGGSIGSAGGTPANGLALWNGVAWQGVTSSAGSGNNTVGALAVRPDGSVVIGGHFDASTAVAFWNGGPTYTVFSGALTNAHPGIPTSVLALHALPDGDVLAAGRFDFAGGIPARNVARLHGSTWSAVDGGVDGFVFGLGGLRDGDVIAVGDFESAGSVAGSVIATSVARLHSTCPASAVSYGTGCSGSAGPVQLVADTLPFVGATYRSTATGFGPNSFGLWYVGTAMTSIPLASVVPQAGAGCDLLANGDLAINIVFQSSGQVTDSGPVPATAALIGVVLFNQVAQVEVDASLALVLMTTSNGLQLTIGVF